jgi:hypothetical protein
MKEQFATSDGKTWGRCRYVDDGMEVVAPYVHEGRRIGLRCHVAVAAGYHARVVNEQRGFARWFHVDDLRVAL